MTIYKFLIPVLCSILVFGCGSPTIIQADDESPTQLEILPDYSDVVFPANIAPINFVIDTTFEKFQVVISSSAQGVAPIVLHGSEQQVDIPLSQWEKFRRDALGADFTISISLQNAQKRWTAYPVITNYLSKDSIDNYLTYRLIRPGYELFHRMGIYQRDLSSFDEDPIIENHSTLDRCMNCHSYAQQSADNMMLHVRGKDGGTIIRKGGKTYKVTGSAGDMITKATYPNWHPSGKFIGFSANLVQQIFHLAGSKSIEIIDSDSDIVIYDIERNAMITSEQVYGDAYRETYPDFSPDGRTIYFCRSKPMKEYAGAIDSILYSLCRASFDPTTGKIGDVTVLIDADSLGLSIAFPKPSPDGKYLMFNTLKYGVFPVHHPNAELNILDLASGEYAPATILNSPFSESYHSWSNTGRWYVLSSKRLDGQWARPFFAHFDPETGKFAKPFLMPQKRYDEYIDQINSYNIPQFVTSKIKNTKEITDISAQESEPVTKLIFN